MIFVRLPDTTGEISHDHQEPGSLCSPREAPRIPSSPMLLQLFHFEWTLLLTGGRIGLHRRFDCYRLERPVAGRVCFPLKNNVFSRRTE